jgi:protease-4
MRRSLFARVGSALHRLWWLLDQGRRVLVNLMLLALIVAGLWLWWHRGPDALEPKTALVLGLAGPLVEQSEGSLRDAALRHAGAQEGTPMRLRDLVAVLDAAARDEKVPHALLMLDDFAGAGLPTLREAAAAIERFRAAGKKVYAWGSSFDQKQYYLAAHADEVWLHPMGAVFIEGFGRYRTYYRDAFDRVGISPNVVRVGKFKNAAETFSNSAPSPETIESDRALYGSLWTSYTRGVEKARRLPEGAVARLIDTLPQSLQAAGGDTARLALEAKWVDGLKTRDELRALLIERGAKDDESHSFRQVAFAEYLRHVKPRTDGDAIGIVVAQGEIGDGPAPAGRVGGLSTSEHIRKAREDDKVKAIVLRVNSPGGSAYGSELVRRELELTRKAGKPVVVSMGDVAASGGYWISMAADEIIADEATITGSIGVVGLLPTAQAALDKIGVHTGGTTTTWLVGAYDPRRDVDPRLIALVQSAIEHVYRDFLGLVATQRQTSPEKVDAVGQGRAWSGRHALERGLVDRLGSFDDALKSAARLAKMDGTPRLTYFEEQPGRLQRWLQRFGGALQAAFGLSSDLPAAASALGLLPPPLAREVTHDLAWLLDVAERRQPFAAVTHCLCEAP